MDFGPICLVSREDDRRMGFTVNTQDLFNLIGIEQDI